MTAPPQLLTEDGAAADVVVDSAVDTVTPVAVSAVVAAGASVDVAVGAWIVGRGTVVPTVETVVVRGPDATVVLAGTITDADPDAGGDAATSPWAGPAQAARMPAHATQATQVKRGIPS